MRVFRAVILISVLTTVLNLGAQPTMLGNISLSDITPHGWLNIMLENQKNNFLSKLDKEIYPFTQGGWGAQPFLRTKNGITYGFWVPYEQTAYYYDGKMRCGLLLKDSTLISNASSVIYNSINKNINGVIGSEIAPGEMQRWPHAVFFRSMMAEYEANKDPLILSALRHHYVNDTVKYAGRDFCNIEILAWLYDNTKDKIYLSKILQYKSYLESNPDACDRIFTEFKDTKRTEVHGVTYHELLKLPIIFYSLTGDKHYLQMANNGFEKLEKYNLLPDGVASSEEGLSDNGALNAHEMCNVVDYMWTCIYMLRATKDIKWADKIEKALFNAGLGGITKNFDAHQYYSCPNQIVCTEYSSKVSAYEPSRLAYRLAHRPPCCTGNLNRMLPIYIGAQWMKGDENKLYKMLYGAGEVKYNVAGKTIVFEEQSTYPFGDTIRIEVKEGDANVKLNLRVPQWCESPYIYINNKKVTKIYKDGFATIARDFKKGDVIELILPKKVEFRRWNVDGMIVERGPLLFALPIKANKTSRSIFTPKLQSNTYLGYELSPASKWNYILYADNKSQPFFDIEERSIGINENPWECDNSPIKIKVAAYEYTAWQPIYKKIMIEGGEILSMLTPELPARGSMIYALNGLLPTSINLEPYGRTLLRISMFPFWIKDKIPAEVLATDCKLIN